MKMQARDFCIDSNLYQTNSSAENNYVSWAKAQNKGKSRCLKVLEINSDDQKKYGAMIQ